MASNETAEGPRSAYRRWSHGSDAVNGNIRCNVGRPHCQWQLNKQVNDHKRELMKVWQDAGRKRPGNAVKGNAF